MGNAANSLRNFSSKSENAMFSISTYAKSEAIFHYFFKISPANCNEIAMLVFFQQPFDFLPNRNFIHAVHNSISRIVSPDWEVFCL